MQGPSDTGQEWANNFVRDLLNRWRKAISAHDGLFRPDFDEFWKPTPSNRPLTLVSQCRLIYTMSVGFKLTGDETFRAVAQAGIDAFERYFRLSDAHYCWSIGRDGMHDNTEVNAYGYAFIILAQATAASSLNRPDLAESALKTWRFAEQELGDPHGGLEWRRPVYRSDVPSEAKSQNPLMHSFEALMALARCEVADAQIALHARLSAAKLLALISRLAGFDRGRLIEWHAPDWKPMPVDIGGFVDIGHCFEWAFLLSEWHTLTGDESALSSGERFLKSAVEIGLQSDGSIASTADPSGAVLSNTHGLWQQCEALRTLWRYAYTHANPLALAHLDNAFEFYKATFADQKNGGVFAGPVVDGELKSRHKGDGWKLDYHSTNMLIEVSGCAI